MPHHCIKCNTVIKDDSKDTLKGCSKCGSTFFFYVRKEQVPEAEERIENLTTKEKEKIEKDIFDIMGTERDKDKPVILDFESIRSLSPGKFEIDIRHIFGREPLVYETGQGKYIIDLPSTFQLRKKK